MVLGTELVVEDSGFLAIASQRAVYVGSRKSIEFAYSKLLNMAALNLPARRRSARSAANRNDTADRDFGAFDPDLHPDTGRSLLQTDRKREAGELPDRAPIRPGGLTLATGVEARRRVSARGLPR